MIEASDLEAVERMITLRFPTTRAESERAARMRALVAVTSELTRTLSTYSRHALVHCQGTAGASDLSADTARLSAAMHAFCIEIRTVAAEYAACAPTTAVDAVGRDPSAEGWPPRQTDQRPLSTVTSRQRAAGGVRA